MVKPEELTVLVVDDEEDVREYLGDILEDAGFAVLKACDGVAALEAIKRRRPDFISLDLVMPHKSGIKLLYELRHHKEWARIPVMIVTAHAHDELGSNDLESALTSKNLSGPRVYLEKPVEPEDYIRAVRENLGVEELEVVAAPRAEQTREEVARLLKTADDGTLRDLLKLLKKRGP